MRTPVAILGLVLIVLGWINATYSARHPALAFVGFGLLLAARRWPSRDLGIAAGVLTLPLVYWLWDASFDQGTICSAESGCVTPWSPPDAVRVVVESVPYVVVAAMSWRLRRHDPLAGRAVVPARESGL